MATPKRRSPPSPTAAEAIKEHFKKPRSTSPGPASPLEQEPINRLSNVQGASCVHDVSYPENYQAQPNQLVWSSPKPAREYPFTLDPFQQEAVRCLEAGESVLVSAHTSAGKTVVAEYAIAMSLKNNQRVVYTSPIKALSNQKFRELAEEFSDVGLMTGDVTISPNASCLVMTTEILRSMQYRGSEIMREVAWIIFDEVHYMRDRERGVVWEESIVMAPKNARFVFLSATVPNAKEFADWVAKVHQQPCHIVYTDFRPTPLQHLIFPSGADGLYVVVDEKGTFRDDNFQKAMNAVSVNVADHTGKRDNGKWRRGLNIKNGESSDIFKIVQMIMQNNYSPAIVFSFSKRDCENLAVQMLKLDLNDENEKELVEGIFWNAMDSLSDDDKKLPQVSQLLPHLKRGIGVHHSGLLPILKEVIEILFQEGLIKCLFATETFSIGLNMPAKTVVFTSVRKFDGTKFRVITSGEYIQMSGRAGRRGLDAIGTCILMVDEKLEPAAAKSIVKGAADPLNSAFHLSYNMILNQMRCEESNPENLLKQSFYQFQCDRGLPTLKERIQDLEEERDSISIEDEEKVVEYNKMLKQIQELKSDIRNIVFSPRHCIPFFQPGRLVRIMRSCNGDEEYQKLLEHEPAIWGVIVNFEKVSEAVEEEDNDKKVQQFKVDVLVQCLPDKNNNRKVVKIVPFKEPGEPIVTALPLTQLQSLSAVRVLIPKDLRPIEQRERMIKAADEALRRCPQMLDPIDDMKIQSNSYEKYTRRLESLEALLEKHPLSSSPTLNYRLKALDKKKALTASIRAARGSIRSASALAFKEELKARKRVLRRLQYTTSDDIVELKGRIACEITSADELVITELFFSGVLKEASTEQLAALLSCFVWQEKVKGSKKLSEELSGLYSQLKDTARKIGKVQDECKISTDIEEYVNSFRPDIMELVYAWCKGSSFLEIMKMAEVFEGSLVRALRRLEELLQELIVVTKSIGDQDMEAKFQDTVVKIKRDIVFAASLYL